MEIKVEINKKYLVNYEALISIGEVPFLWKRIAAICCCCPDPHKKTDGYPWALDKSNDWKVGLLSEMDRAGDRPIKNNVVVVQYRYGTEGVMDSLREFLEWVFK